MLRFKKFRWMNFWAVCLIFLTVMVSLPSQVAYAETAGPKNPSTESQSREPPYVNQSWEDEELGYLATSDDNYVQITSKNYDTDDLSKVLYVGGFGFGIAAGSTINGITVDIERHQSAGGAIDGLVQITRSGTREGDNKKSVTAWTGDLDTYYTYGSTSDKWGLTWTVDQANNIGVALAVKATTDNTDIHVDHITVTIDYTPPSGTLTVDIVDAAGDPVASPSIAMGDVTFSFSYQTANGTLGISTQKIRVENTTANSEWTLTIAADTGPTAFWDGAASDYDFNDPTANAGDGADADSLGGQMTVNASIGTLGGTCSVTDINIGSSTSFSEGATNSVTLLTAGASADTGCYWDLTGVSISQTIPAEQPAASDYTIDMTLTVTAI